jgi:hypothetical protein
MANKDQKRGNREVRKPKQAKSKAAPATSPFVATMGARGPASKPGGKK